MTERTLTAEEIDALANGPLLDRLAIAAQAKRVPALETERDRYRKVAELAREYRRCHGLADRMSGTEEESQLDAALVAVGMKVEE
jgi:hypothetical protein